MHTLLKTGLAIALVGALSACNPNSPQAQRDAEEAKAAARQAGSDLSQAARTTATAAGEAAEAAATSTAEAAGRAAVAADRATDEMARDLDRATVPIQDAYHDGKAQERANQSARDPLNNADHPSVIMGPVPERRDDNSPNPPPIN